MQYIEMSTNEKYYAHLSMHIDFYHNKHVNMQNVKYVCIIHDVMVTPLIIIFHNINYAIQLHKLSCMLQTFLFYNKRSGVHQDIKLVQDNCKDTIIETTKFKMNVTYFYISNVQYREWVLFLLETRSYKLQVNLCGILIKSIDVI